MAPSIRRHWLRRALLWSTAGIAVVVLAAAGLSAAAWYRLDHAAHRVAVPAALLVGGHGDVLVTVHQPAGAASIFAIRTVNGRSVVLTLPQQLSSGAKEAALGTIAPERASAMVRAVRRLGVPVSSYVGLDLSSVPAGSVLGRLARGQLDLAALVTNPVAAFELLTSAGHHLTIGPGTSIMRLLGIARARTCLVEHLPARTVVGHRLLVPAQPRAGAAVERFLTGPHQGSCEHATTLASAISRWSHPPRVSA